MKKIVVPIVAVTGAICAWWNDIMPQDIFDVVYAIYTAFMNYIMPRQEGFKSYFVSGYLGARSFLGKIFGWQPFSIYDHILDRAQANPLEAFGAVSVIFCLVWLIIFKYRIVYRFYHWLLVSRHKR